MNIVKDYFMSSRGEVTVTNTVVMGTGITATKSDTAYIGDEVIPNKTLEERIRVCKLVIDKWSKLNPKAIYTHKLIGMLTEKIKRDYCE